MWAFDEYAFLSSWMDPSYRAQADTLLPAWFKTWLSKGTWVLITGFPMSFGAGIANTFTHRAGLQTAGALKWYWLGVAFTAAHFLYAPTAIRLLKAIQAGHPDGQTTKSMGEWLRMHFVRTVITDLPAFVCFTIATLTAV